MATRSQGNRSRERALPGRDTGHLPGRDYAPDTEPACPSFVCVSSSPRALPCGANPGTRVHADQENADQNLCKTSFTIPSSDIYFAEKKILTSLRKMAKVAQSPELRAARLKSTSARPKDRSSASRAGGFRHHRGASAERKDLATPSTTGILDEGKEVMQEYKGSRPPSMPAAARGRGRRSSITRCPAATAR